MSHLVYTCTFFFTCMSRGGVVTTRITSNTLHRLTGDEVTFHVSTIERLDIQLCGDVNMKH